MAGVRRTFLHRWAQAGAKTDPLDAKVDTGWIAEKPPYQFFNWLLGRSDDMLAHVEEQAVPDWHTDTVYTGGGLAMGSDRVVYRAVVANTANDPTTDGGTNWLPQVRVGTDSNYGTMRFATLLELINGTSFERAISPGLLVQRIAGTALTGLIQLATDAEAQALSDADKALTPGSLGTVVATEAAKGIVELANAAEVLAGSDLTRAVSPGALGALASSLADPGYQTFPGGLILQWGSTINVTGAAHDVVLPIAFPNAFFYAGVSIADGRNTSGETSPGAKPQLLTHIRLSTSNTAPLVYWLAIGN